MPLVDPKDFGPSKPADDLDDMFGPLPDAVDLGEVVYPSVYRRPEDEGNEKRPAVVSDEPLDTHDERTS